MNETPTPFSSYRLLSLRQASELIHRDRSALHDDVRAGKLPSIRVGRMWLVTEADLREFDKKPRVGRDLPRGPKSKLSIPQVADALERLLADGASVVDAMRTVGVDQPRYYREDSTNPGFRARMEAARARGASKRARRFTETLLISRDGASHAPLETPVAAPTEVLSDAFLGSLSPPKIAVPTSKRTSASSSRHGVSEVPTPMRHPVLAQPQRYGSDNVLHLRPPAALDHRLDILSEADHILQQGVAVYDQYWLDSAAARVGNDVGSAARIAAFKKAKTACVAALAALGLPYLTPLPDNAQARANAAVATCRVWLGTTR